MTEKCTRNYRGGLTPESWYYHTALCSVWIFLNVVNSLPFQFKKALNNWKKKKNHLQFQMYLHIYHRGKSSGQIHTLVFLV